MKIRLITLVSPVFAALLLAGCAGGIEGEAITTADTTSVASTTKTISGTLVLPSEEEAAANLAVKSLGLMPNKVLNAENVVTITVSNPVTGEELGSAVRDNSTGAWSMTIENSKIEGVLDPDDATRAALKITGSSDYDSVRQIADHPVTTTGVDTSETNYDTDMAASILDDSDVDGLYDVAGIVAGARTAKNAVDADCVTLVENALRPTPSSDGALCAARLAQANEDSENMQTVFCRMNAVRKKIMNCLSANRVLPSAVIARFSKPGELNKAMTRMDTLLSDTEREALLAKAVELCPTSVSEAGMRTQINMLKNAPFKNFNQGFANLTSGSAELRAQIKATTSEDAAKAMAYTILSQEMSTVSGGTYGSDHLNRLKEGMKGVFERGESGKIANGGFLVGTVLANGFFDDSFKEMMGDPSKRAGMIDTLMAVDTTGLSRNELRTYGAGVMDLLDADDAFTGVLDEGEREALVGMVGTGLRQGTITNQADLQSQAGQYVTNYRQYGDQIHQSCDILATETLKDECRQNYMPMQQQGNIAIRPVFAVTAAQLGGCGDEVAQAPALTCAQTFVGTCNPNGDGNLKTYSYQYLAGQVSADQLVCLCTYKASLSSHGDGCMHDSDILANNNAILNACGLGGDGEQDNGNSCQGTKEFTTGSCGTCGDGVAPYTACWGLPQNLCTQYYMRNYTKALGVPAASYDCIWDNLQGCIYEEDACLGSISGTVTCGNMLLDSGDDCVGKLEIPCNLYMFIEAATQAPTNCHWTGTECKKGYGTCQFRSCGGDTLDTCSRYNKVDGVAEGGAECRSHYELANGFARPCGWHYGGLGIGYLCDTGGEAPCTP